MRGHTDGEKDAGFCDEEGGRSRADGEARAGGPGTERGDLGVAVEKRARDNVTSLREESLIGGKNPSGVAAACLYQAAQQSGVAVRQQDLCELADVSRLTLRSTLSDLESLGEES